MYLKGPLQDGRERKGQGLLWETLVTEEIKSNAQGHCPQARHVFLEALLEAS